MSKKRVQQPSQKYATRTVRTYLLNQNSQKKIER